MNFELRLGDCMDTETGLPSLAAGSVTHVITDPPYSARVHEGQAPDRSDGAALTVLNYDGLTSSDAMTYGKQIARVSEKWALIMTDHSLFPAWESALGRYTFAPVPIVIEGMTVRLQGDGPSSWAIWLAVNRAIGLMDGTKPGAYVGPRSVDFKSKIKGTKPLWLMEKLIRDYTKPGDLICDPFVGSGTTGVAAIRLGRRFLGWEKDPSHHKIAMKRLLQAREQLSMFDRTLQTATQLTIGGDHVEEKGEEDQAQGIPDHGLDGSAALLEVQGERSSAGEADDGRNSEVDRRDEIPDRLREEGDPFTEEDHTDEDAEEFGAQDRGW